ncbi:hypothetical protein U1Q18_023435 [Sarracenia purpurea var. burkii]
MDARESASAGVTGIGATAPSNYHLAAKTENPNQVAGSQPVFVSSMTAGVAETTGTKKRGRPRKYGPDGSLARALVPMPISSSAPPPSTGGFSADKRGRGRPIGSKNKQRHKLELENSGNGDCSNFLFIFTSELIHEAASLIYCIYGKICSFIMPRRKGRQSTRQI